MTDETNTKTEISVPEAMEGLNYEKTEWYGVYKLLLEGKISPGRIELNLKKWNKIRNDIVKLYKEYNTSLKNNKPVVGYKADMKTLARMTQHIFYLTDTDEAGYPMTPQKLLLGDLATLKTETFTYQVECIRKMHLDILRYVAIRMLDELNDFKEKGRAMIEEHNRKDRELRNARGKTKVQCDICGRQVSYCRLADHKKTAICRALAEI